MKIARTAAAAVLLAISLLAGCDRPSPDAFEIGPEVATVVAPPPLPEPLRPAIRRGDRVAVEPAPAADGGPPVRTVLNVVKPMQYGDFLWHDEGVPAGPVWVRVDLPRQILSVFRGGHEIGTAVVLYGADKMPTPLGTFPILAKLKDHKSSIYDAPMPYTLRLTGDGVAIHGSNIRWGAATHGCVGVPTDFAAKLFDQVALGGKVTIVGGDPRT